MRGLFNLFLPILPLLVNTAPFVHCAGSCRNRYRGCPDFYNAYCIDSCAVYYGTGIQRTWMTLKNSADYIIGIDIHNVCTLNVGF